MLGPQSTSVQKPCIGWVLVFAVGDAANRFMKILGIGSTSPDHELKVVGYSFTVATTVPLL